MTALNLPLVPRSPPRAVLQILLCALLFRARPDLLPPWHHVLLAILFISSLSLLATARRCRRRRRHYSLTLVLLDSSTPPPPPPQWKWMMSGSPLCRLAARLQSCTRRLTEALRRARDATRAAMLFCVAAAVHMLVCGLPALGWRWVAAGRRAGRAAAAWGRRRALELRALGGWLVPVARRTTCAACILTTQSVCFWAAEARCAAGSALHTGRWWRLRGGGVLSARRQLGRGAGVATAACRSVARRLVWMCLCVAHFLAFTLGLTIVFPWLCAYGFVVSFLHLLLNHGATTLASDVASLLGL